MKLLSLIFMFVMLSECATRSGTITSVDSTDSTDVIDSTDSTDVGTVFKTIDPDIMTLYSSGIGVYTNTESKKIGMLTYVKETFVAMSHEPIPELETTYGIINDQNYFFYLSLDGVFQVVEGARTSTVTNVHEISFLVNSEKRLLNVWGGLVFYDRKNELYPNKGDLGFFSILKKSDKVYISCFDFSKFSVENNTTNTEYSFDLYSIKSGVGVRYPVDGNKLYSNSTFSESREKIRNELEDSACTQAAFKQNTAPDYTGGDIVFKNEATGERISVDVLNDFGQMSN